MSVVCEERNGGTLIHVGNAVLIERRFQPETDEQSKIRMKDGDPIYAWIVYELVQVEDGVHPVHGFPTTLHEVWTIHNDECFSRDDAMAVAMKLAEMV